MAKEKLKQIRRKSVRDQVIEQLRDSIVRGVWKPGTKLPSEAELGQSLGVSRVSVREGIQHLVSLGLLDTRHGEGTFVRTYEGDAHANVLLAMLVLQGPDIYHVLEYRRVMEKGAAALAAEKAKASDIQELERCFREMDASRGDVSRFADADLAFHLALAKATGNPIIAKVNDVIRSVLRVSMDHIVATLGVSDGLFYHRRILDAVKAGDAAAAEAVMEEHVVRTIDRLKAGPENIAH